MRIETTYLHGRVGTFHKLPRETQEELVALWLIDHKSPEQLQKMIGASDADTPEAVAAPRRSVSMGEKRAAKRMKAQGSTDAGLQWFFGEG